MAGQDYRLLPNEIKEKCRGQIFLDVTNRKIDTLSDLSDDSFDLYPNRLCTIMILHNLLSVHWLPIPCDQYVLDPISMICMEKSNDYYQEPQLPLIRFSKVPTAYYCLDKTMISYIYVNDSFHDCKDGSTSNAFSYMSKTTFNTANSANFSLKNLPLLPMKLCQDLNGIDHKLFEVMCPVLLTLLKVYCPTIFGNITEFTLDVTKSTNFENITTDNMKYLCLYEPDTCSHVSGFLNGRFLLDCETFQCKESYFKCPGYYCVPWRVVCNNIWDCPGGTDEMMNCSHTNCPGQFRCHNTSICLAPENICDDIVDCVFGDDEYFCYPELPECPVNCSCVVYSMVCDKSDFKMFQEKVPFISVDISYSAIHLISQFFRQFYQIVFLRLKLNGIVKLCTSLDLITDRTLLYLLDVSRNNISSLSVLCFRRFSQLAVINFSRNQIKQIKSRTFDQTSSVIILDLSQNELLNLHKNAFHGLFKLFILKLHNNNLIWIDPKTFVKSRIEIIRTDDSKICCIKPLNKTLCQIEATPSYSCTHRIIENAVIKIILWIVIFWCLLLNVSAVVLNLRNMKPSKKAVSYNYAITVQAILAGDSLICLNILVIAIADSYYAYNFFMHEYFWRSSAMCYITSFLSTCHHLISCYLIIFIALSRYCLVDEPFDTLFLNSQFVKRCIVGPLFFMYSCSIALTISYRYTSTRALLPTGLCLMFGKIDNTAIGLFTHIVILMVEIASTVCLPIIYTMLHFSRKKSSASAGLNKHDENSVKSLLISLASLLCWVPSIIIHIVMLAWIRHPYSVLVNWYTLILPLNALLDPCIFVLSKDLATILFKQ